MSNSLKKENRQLTIDPHIIFDVIKSQSGALDKAMAELVMNSIDAGATRVDIVVNDTGFKVSDNGKGFPSKEAILNWFEKFGTKHEDGDAKFGRFRMGRGQALSFASTIWHSGTHRMDVDIRNRGLDYDLHEVENSVPGCIIEGVFYTPLSKMRSFGGEEMKNTHPFMQGHHVEHKPSVSRLIAALTTMVMYVDIPVFVNDLQLNKDVKSLNWDFNTKDAYMNLSTSAMESSELVFYNMGIFVCAIPSWRAGCSGIVVSKKAIKVNFARNAILTEECPVYQRIMDKVDTYVHEAMAKGAIKNEQQRSYLARRLINNQIPEDEGYQLKVFTDIRGRNLNLEEIIKNWDTATMPEEYSSLNAAEFVHNSKKAFVFSRKNLERFEVPSFELLLLHLSMVLPNIENLDFYSFDMFEGEYQGFDNIIQDEDVTFKERIILDVLRKNQNIIKKAVEAVSPMDLNSRKIFAGESDRGMAWTNGEDFIAIDRKTLKLADKGYTGFAQLCGIIGHEYCHNSSDLGSHQHPDYFYETFHNAMFPDEVSAASGIGGAAFKMNRTYMELLLLNKLSIPSMVLRDIAEAKVIYGHYLLNDKNKVFDEIFASCKPISPEKYFEISQWIFSMQIEAEEMTWLHMIVRAIGTPELLEKGLSHFLNNSMHMDNFYAHRRLKELICSGVFQELVNKLGVEIPKHVFNDPYDHPIENDLIRIRPPQLKVLKEKILEKLKPHQNYNTTKELNPYQFQKDYRAVLHTTEQMKNKNSVDLDGFYTVDGLADQMALNVIDRILMLSELVDKKLLSKKYIFTSYWHGYTEKGFESLRDKDAYMISDVLLRALAHTNIENGSLDAKDLINKTKLSHSDIRNSFKPVKHKLERYMY